MGAEVKQRRIDAAAAASSEYHKRQMETNSDAYHLWKRVKQATYASKNPEKVDATARNAQAKAIEEKKYYCEPCDLPCKSDHDLTVHLKTEKHRQNAEGRAKKPFVCQLCNKDYNSKDQLTRHNKAKKHLRKMAETKVLESAVD